jgi:membrane protease YdiL (CAAX protease family)
MKNKFFTLWFSGLLGAAAVLPYAFTLQHDIITKTGKPLPIIILASIVQTAVLLAIAIFFGLRLSERLGLPVLAPFDPTLSTKDKLRSFIPLTVSAGALTSIAILTGDKIFSQFLPQLAIANIHIPAWKTLLASLYGGVVEELLMRLFCLSLFAWLLAKITKAKEPAKNNMLMWAAIALSSILFGLGHLPVTAALTTITPLVILRAVVLNGIGGLVFGWLYWKKGLEYGMAAHFTTDILLLVILPLLLK